jgi:hypothetical protein
MSNQIGDQYISCRDCVSQFVFDPGEQEFFHLKGFPPPIRCKSCRALRRQGHRREAFPRVDVTTRYEH